MGQLILIDNDALLKLARYGLLDEAIGIFSCTPADVRVLATAKYSLLPAKKRLYLCEDEASAVRLESFLRASKPLNVQVADPGLLDALNAVPNIDSEALLLAVGATNKETLVITGDKRALAALCSNESIAHVAQALAGRVISMEILFSILIECQFVFVQERVRAKPNVDTALRIVFGVNSPADFESVREGLASYVKYLCTLTGTLLYPISN